MTNEWGAVKNALDNNDRMKDAALAYAADLRLHGFMDVEVFRYDTPLDNLEPHWKNHKTAFGYAVRYSSTPELDAKIYPGRTPAPKYHDRSLIVFADTRRSDDGGAIPKQQLMHGGVLADFPGEGVVPYWAAWWTPEDNPHITGAHHVGMKIFPKRDTDQSYPWQIGPARYYHLIMSKVETPRFSRGPEPAGDR